MGLSWSERGSPTGVVMSEDFSQQLTSKSIEKEVIAMIKFVTKVVFAFVAIVSMNLISTASAMEPALSYGKYEYDRSCSVCHGRAGTGGGPVSDYFKTSPPDLTQIKRSNRGVFPSLAIYQMIDGRRGLKAHGHSKMPVWGDRYLLSANANMREKNVPHDVNPEFTVHSRILSLVYFLESIQK